MGRASDAQKAERLNHARGLLHEFDQLPEAVEQMAQDCSISPRQAYRYLQQAERLKEPLAVGEPETVLYGETGAQFDSAGPVVRICQEPFHQRSGQPCLASSAATRARAWLRAASLEAFALNIGLIVCLKISWHKSFRPWRQKSSGSLAQVAETREGMNDKAAAIYARVSSDRQKEAHTIASQTAALIQFAETEGFGVPKEWVFQDEGYSGSSLLRPGLEAIRDLAAEGHIEAVLIHSPDRLSRKYAYQVLLAEEFSKHGVAVRFVKSPSVTTPEDQLLVQFQGMIAEYERAQILERSRRGKAASRSTRVNQRAVGSAIRLSVRQEKRRDGGLLRGVGKRGGCGPAGVPDLR